MWMSSFCNDSVETQSYRQTTKNCGCRNKIDTENYYYYYLWFTNNHRQTTKNCVCRNKIDTENYYYYLWFTNGNLFLKAQLHQLEHKKIIWFEVVKKANAGKTKELNLLNYTILNSIKNGLFKTCIPVEKLNWSSML